MNQNVIESDFERRLIVGVRLARAAVMNSDWRTLVPKFNVKNIIKL
jgi:hypothetical protein